MGLRSWPLSSLSAAAPLPWTLGQHALLDSCKSAWETVSQRASAPVTFTLFCGMNPFENTMRAADPLLRKMPTQIPCT